MPTVWTTAPDLAQIKFHKNQTCPMMVKKPPSGRSHTPVEVEVDEIHYPTPCLLCYPDAPRAVSAHVVCRMCSPRAARPCVHNGGLMVYMPRVHRAPSLSSTQGDVYYRRQWVWPEVLRHYVN